MTLLVLLAAAAAPPAWAYSCAVSPARDAVIVKTDNESAQPVICKVECRFTTPAGTATVACSQQIPPGAKGWYVCLRPIDGKSAQFAGGSESCR
jgi:multisubunit Na+/H+ antiporter MnhE subunit